jgi:hypothetical protein
VDYCGLNQNQAVRSNEVRASDSAIFYDQAVRIHAVSLLDGVPATAAVCGYPCRVGSRDTLNRDVDWMADVHRTMRCARCSERLGVADGLGV